MSNALYGQRSVGHVWWIAKPADRWDPPAEHFGERIEVIDHYHASEHIRTVANALYGEGTAETSTWAEE